MLLSAVLISASRTVEGITASSTGRYLPKFSFTTDNAAMVAITGYYKYLDKEFCDIAKAPFARVEL